MDPTICLKLNAPDYFRRLVCACLALGLGLISGRAQDSPYELALQEAERVLAAAEDGPLPANPLLNGPTTSIGDARFLTILLSFSDEPAPLPAAQLEANIFGNGTAQAQRLHPEMDSLRNYYQRASGGRLMVDGTVLDWFPLSAPRNSYRPGFTADWNQARYDMIRGVLQSADAAIDFAEFDTDGDGFVEGVHIIFAGQFTEPGDFFWGEQSDFLKLQQTAFDGVKLAHYTWTPALLRDGGSDFDPRIVTHEHGHFFGLPDLYSEPDQGVQGGVGGFDLMDGNRYNMNAFTRWLLGWESPTIVRPGPARSLTFAPAHANSGSETSAAFVLPASGMEANRELLVIENREPVGNDLNGISHDLAIWHVDFSGNNVGGTQKHIRLIEADAGNEIENFSLASSTDFFAPGATFGPNGLPESSGRYGPSGFTLDSISRQPDHRVQARLGFSDVSGLSDLAVRTKGGLELSGGDTLPKPGNLTAFGSVETGTERVHSFWVENRGQSDLVFQPPGIRLTGSESFHLLSAVPPRLLPGNRVQVDISFRPQIAGPHRTRLEILSNDPNEPQWITELEGMAEVAPARIEIHGDVDFGALPVGRTASLAFRIQNTGGSTLRFLGPPQWIGEDAGAFRLLNALGDIPFGEERTFTVSFQPTERKAWIAALRLTSNDPDHPSADIVVQGVGTEARIEVRARTPEGTQIENGDSSPSPAAHTDFGGQLVQTESEHRFFILNTGLDSLTVSSALIGGSHAGMFSAELPENRTVAPSESLELSIRYQPSRVGTHTGRILINSSDPATPVFLFDVQGQGIEAEPKLEVYGQEVTIFAGDTTPAMLGGTYFGMVRIGDSVAHSFRLANIGPGVLNIFAIDLVGAHPDVFELGSHLPLTIQPGEEHILSVRFAPSQLEQQDAELIIRSNDKEEAQYGFAIRGWGLPAPSGTLEARNGPRVIAPGAAPSLLTGTDMGEVQLTTTSAPTFITLANSGVHPLRLLGAGLSSGQPASFELRGFTARTLAPGETSTIELRYAPQTLGRETSELILRSNAEHGDLRIPIAGSGLPPPAPMLQVRFGETRIVNNAPPSQDTGTDFSDRQIGSGAVTHVLQLENSGDAPLLMGAAGLSGSGASEFTLAAQETSALLPGQARELRITYRPEKLGEQLATIYLPSEPPFQISLRGIGRPVPRGELVVSTEASRLVSGALPGVDFGTREEDSLAETRTFTIMNEGTVDLDIESIELVTTAPHIFALGTGLPERVMPGEIKNIRVTLSPHQVGSFTAELRILIREDEAPFIVPLVGVTTPKPAPRIALFGKGVEIEREGHRASISTGTNLGLSAMYQSRVGFFTVQNTGTAPLDLGRTRIEGSGRSHFAVTGPMVSLQPQSTLSLFVQFRPSAPGRIEAELVIPSSDPDLPEFRVALMGWAYIPPLPDLEVLAGATLLPSSSPVLPETQVAAEIGQRATLELRLRNRGTFPLTLGARGLQLVGAGGVFSVTQPARTHLAAGETTEVTVTFAPKHGVPVLARLDIPSDDPRHPIYQVNLRGAPILRGPPILEVQSNEIPLLAGDFRTSEENGTHFGDVLLGEEVRHRFLISNAGESPLRISEIYLIGGGQSAFTIDAPADLSLSEGRSQEIEIAYHPSVEARHGLFLVIWNNDPKKRNFIFKLTGNAVASLASADNLGQLVPTGSTWRYNDDASPPPSNWMTPGFPDGNWPSGLAQLGYGESDEATSLRPNGITSWFRHSFEVSDINDLPNELELSLVRDDGAVVYINGSEVLRSNMPDGPISPVTLATDFVFGRGEYTPLRIPIAPTQLSNGRNVIAVEIHQVSANNRDMSFDLTLLPRSSAKRQLKDHGKLPDAFRAGLATSPGQPAILSVESIDGKRITLQRGPEGVDLWLQQGPWIRHKHWRGKATEVYLDCADGWLKAGNGRDTWLLPWKHPEHLSANGPVQLIRNF